MANNKKNKNERLTELDDIQFVTFGPYTYALQSVSGKEIPGSWGEINHELSLIKIRNDVPVDRQKVTLLHEIFHGVLRLIERSSEEPIPEEVFVTAVSPMMLYTLDKNKLVREFLFDD